MILSSSLAQDTYPSALTDKKPYTYYVPSSLKPNSRFVLSTIWRIRLIFYGICFVLLFASSLVIVRAHTSLSVDAKQREASLTELKQLSGSTKSYQSLKKHIAEDQKLGIDTAEATKSLEAIKKSIQDKKYGTASQLITTQITILDKALANKTAQDALIEAKKGILTGKVTDGKDSIGNCTITLLSAGQTVATTTSDSTGTYTFKLEAAPYTLKVELGGFLPFSKDAVTLLAQQTITEDIALTKVPPPTPVPTPTARPKPTPTPTPKPTAVPVSRNDSTAYSTYRKTSVSTSRGTFTADIMTIDLGSGHIRVMVDTANDDDCPDNCYVKSVLSFVQQDGGFAGINGSYFCPTAYADCAGHTNFFYWKQYNSRVKKMINPGNFLGEQDPFLVFDANGHATFLEHWVDYASSGIPIYAGFSCRPLLTLNSQNVLKDSDLDTKQRTAKVGRAALGLKGQTFYSVVVQGATVTDLAAVTERLGLDNAMNYDAGGSTGNVYKGVYKLGPGRNVPNAIVFIEK